MKIRKKRREFKWAVWGYYLRVLFNRPYKNTMGIEDFKKKYQIDTEEGSIIIEELKKKFKVDTEEGN